VGFLNVRVGSVGDIRAGHALISENDPPSWTLNRVSRSPSDGEKRGPRCIKHRGALLCLASAEDLAPTLARMSGLQQLIFKTLCALTCAS
jgi:hypothetical protein